MNSIFKKALAIAAVTVAGFASVQSAQALQHPGMNQFCNTYSSQCRIDRTAQVTMSDELLALMQQVNTRVNASIRAVADRPGRDIWELNPRSGDCEDFALSKRAALIAKGVAPGALRIAMTKSPRGAPHAVLVVKTSRGDYVLDNLKQRVMALGSSGYRLQFISTQNPRVFARAG